MQSFHVFSTLFVFSTAVGFFRSWGWPRRLRMPYGANLKIWSCLLALRLEIALSRPDASFVLRPLICLAGLDFPIVDQQSLGCVISVCVCVRVSEFDGPVDACRSLLLDWRQSHVRPGTQSDWIQRTCKTESSECFYVTGFQTLDIWESEMLYPESKSDQKLIWSMEFWKSFDLEMWRISSRALQLWLPQLWPKTPRLSAAFPLSPQLPWQLRLGHFCQICHAPFAMLQTESVSDFQSLLCGFCMVLPCRLWTFRSNSNIVTCVTSSVPSISHILLFLEGGSLQTFNQRWTHFSWSGKRPMSNKIIMHHANILQQRAATDFEKTWASCRWKHYMHASVCATISLGLYLRSKLGKSSNCCQTIFFCFLP